MQIHVVSGYWTELPNKASRKTWGVLEVPENQGVAGSTLAYSWHPRVLTASPFHFQKLSGLNDTIYGHPPHLIRN